MKPVDVGRIHEELREFSRERDWDQFHSVKNLSMALSVEASELVEIFQWMTEAEADGVREDSRLKTRVQDEIADVFIYLLRIAGKVDIDLGVAVAEKMRKNAEKYPVEKSKGNAKKYNDL